MRRMILILLLLFLALNTFSAKKYELKLSPLKKIETTKKEPVKEEFNEEKAILNYIKNEGYTQKSDLRQTTDITMDENTKEIEAEKDGITYTLFINADRETETVEIVDSTVREYYDILNEIVKNNSKIRKIEVATYALGTDIMIYTKENMFEDEYRAIGRQIADKIKANSPFIDKIKVVMYTPYNLEKPLFQENFR